MTVRALIFDVDGTLADTEELHRQAFNAAFAAQRLPWFWGQRIYRDLLKVAGGRERIGHFVDAMDAPAAEKSKLRARAIGIHTEKTQFYARYVAEGRVALRDGVARLFREARAAHVRLALATTTTRSSVDALLAHTLGARSIRWFDVIATGERGIPKKPAPDVYCATVQQLGLRPQDVIAFEDSGDGLAAAKAAQLFTVVTPTGWTADHDFAGADLLLDNLTRGGGLGTLCAAHLRWLHSSREAA